MDAKKLVVVTSLIALVSGGMLAHAAQNGGQPNDAVAEMAKANITIEQAIAAAQQQVGGKASKAELEDENGKLAYSVEVVSGDKVMDVKVDPSTGKVLSAQVDKADREENHEDDE